MVQCKLSSAIDPMTGAMCLFTSQVDNDWGNGSGYLLMLGCTLLCSMLYDMSHLHMLLNMIGLMPASTLQQFFDCHNAYIHLSMTKWQVQSQFPPIPDLATSAIPLSNFQCCYERDNTSVDLRIIP